MSSETRTLPSDFDEEAYLGQNADVRDAVSAGGFPDGASHWLAYGYREVRAHSRRSVSWLEPAPTAAPFLRFEQRLPSPQTAVDVFRGRWACDLSKLLGVDGTGINDLFGEDRRPSQAAVSLGENGRIEGWRVLELGPLEAAHTWRLEQLGAGEIIAIEANVEAYLKCLIVKEELQLKRSRFLLGDFVEFLNRTQQSFDLILASGVLYHLSNPLEAIRQIATHASRCFVWTHYYDRERHPVPFRPIRIEAGQRSAPGWVHDYGDKSRDFWGGTPGQCGLAREDGSNGGIPRLRTAGC